jgi:DNA-directed RNA polymerase specialized sigma24 family protein
VADHTIRIDLDDRIWWKLATAAEQQDTTIAALVETLVRSVTPKREARRAAPERPTGRRIGRASEVRAAVAMYHAQGMNDRQIADVMHCSFQNIQRHRQILGLPAQRSAA